MRMLPFRLLHFRILLSFLVLTLSSVFARTWTSTSGTTLEAELSGFSDGKVTLRKADGGQLTLHVRQLSAEDQAFLKEELKRNPVLQIEDIALFPIQVARSFGYIDVTGRVVVTPTYRKAEPFSDGLGLVEGAYAGFINGGGVPVIGVDQPGPGEAYRSFSDGVAPFRKGSKWGLIDRTGRVILEPRFADIGRFSHQRAVVRVGSEDQWGIGKRGFIDPRGEVVIEPIYNEALDFSDGLAAVNLKSVYGEWGFIDPAGKMIIQPRFHRAYSFYDGLARAMPKEGGGFGLIDKSGEYVLSKSESRRKEGGAEITTTTWYVPGDFGCGVAPVSFRGDLFLVDQKGKKVTKNLPFRQIGQFVEGLASYVEGESFGYLDPSGKVVITAQYAEAGDFQNGLAMVMSETETAYIDRRGRTVWKGAK